MCSNITPHTKNDSQQVLHFGEKDATTIPKTDPPQVQSCSMGSQDKFAKVSSVTLLLGGTSKWTLPRLGA